MPGLNKLDNQKKIINITLAWEKYNKSIYKMHKFREHFM